MTLGDIRTRVARVIGMSSSDTDDLALIDSWANEAVLQFLRATKLNVEAASLAVSAGVGDYTLDYTLLSMYELYWEPADGRYEILLEPLSSRDLIRMRLYQSTVDVSPRYYSLEGAHLLRLYPYPESNSDKLHLLYVPRPSNSLTAAAHSPSASGYGDIPDEYHPTIEAYVKWKAAEAEEHRPSQSGLTFQAEWERGLLAVRSDVQKKSGVVHARKIGGRRRRFPVSPGTDLRYGS